MVPSRPYRVLVLAAWSCIVALAFLSLTPKDHMLRTGFGGHVEHILAYLGIAPVVASAYGATRRRYIVAGLIAYAGLLELLQNFSPGRIPALEDFACSSIGVLLGIALHSLADLRVLMRRGT
jgi:VanZ family protein